MYEKIKMSRKDFPILNTKVYGNNLVYLDNAATTQLPGQVIEKIKGHYENDNANVHRGIHYLSEKSTEAMEAVREHIKRFLCAEGCGEVVFTSGTTDSVNLVAQSFLRHRLGVGDVVVATELEHHSNFVPWQQLCLEKQAEFLVVPVDENGEPDLSRLQEMLDTYAGKVKLVAVTQVSNVTGTVVDTGTIIRMVHAADAPVLIDGAQAMRHMKFDFRGDATESGMEKAGSVYQKLGCDFFCFSGHKMLAPTGVGGVFIREKWLDEMEPYRYGGGMVDQVTNGYTTFPDHFHKLEAGTPNYSGIIALGTALDYLEDLKIEEISAWEQQLLAQAETLLCKLPQVRILGNPKKRFGAISFTVAGCHPYDLASFLDKYGIALRSGSLCAQPILNRFGVSAVLRLSPAFYNTMEEIGYTVKMLQEISVKLSHFRHSK